MHKRMYQRFVMSLLAAGMTAPVFAVAPGFYMGLMMGPASNGGGQQAVQVEPLPTETSPIANTSMANPQSNQFGSRFYLGYKFNTYASFEGGFTYFSGIGYSLKDNTAVAIGGTTARVRGLDIVGKLDYTIRDTVGVFGKAGVTALYTTTPGAMNITNWKSVRTKIPQNPPVAPGNEVYSTQIINSGQSTYTSKLSPTFAVGASYDLNQSWVLDATWTRYMVGGVLSTMDFYALGLSYHIVDTYCGQFLC